MEFRRNQYFKYYVNYPKEKKEKYPVLLFLHGAGERGENHEEFLNCAIIKELEKNGLEIPFLVIAPIIENQADTWLDLQERLFLFIEEVVRLDEVDKDAVSITGISMGAYGVYTIVARHPELFQAAIPVCGGGQRWNMRACKNVPFWIFHGSQDSVIPVYYSEDMVKAIESFGGNVKFTVVEGADHDSWNSVYNRKDVYEFLLQDKLK